MRPGSRECTPPTSYAPKNPSSGASRYRIVSFV
jgi:hypothetical protein